MIKSHLLYQLSYGVLLAFLTAAKVRFSAEIRKFSGAFFNCFLKRFIRNLFLAEMYAFQKSLRIANHADSYFLV
jgi:hypothetical protein